MAFFSRVAQQALRRNRMTAGGATQPLPTDGHGMALPPPRLARLGGACCLLMSVASSDASKRSAEHPVLATSVARGRRQVVRGMLSSHDAMPRRTWRSSSYPISPSLSKSMSTRIWSNSGVLMSISIVWNLRMT